MGYFQQQNPATNWGRAGNSVADLLSQEMFQLPAARVALAQREEMLNARRDVMSAQVQQILQNAEFDKARTAGEVAKTDATRMLLENAIAGGGAASMEVDNPSMPGYNSPTLESGARRNLAIQRGAIMQSLLSDPAAAGRMMLPHNVGADDTAVNALGDVIARGVRKPTIVGQGSLAYQQDGTVLPGMVNTRPGAKVFLPPGVKFGGGNVLEGLPPVTGVGSSGGAASSPSAALSALSSAWESGQVTDEQAAEVLLPILEALRTGRFGQPQAATGGTNGVAGKPTTIQQNGFTYTLNPVTGQYE